MIGGAHPPAVDDVRLGQTYRALRHRRRLRQLDLAHAIGMSQDVVSSVETGSGANLKLRTLRSLAGALGAELVVSLRWRGGDLDRLLDEAHAALVVAVCRRLVTSGWVVEPEVTYSIFGERGSIDVLAGHVATRSVLVVEVKTALTSIEETLRRHDAKRRLAPSIARDRFGWTPLAIGRLLVLPEDTTARRRVADHDSVFQLAYPMRARDLRTSLASPSGTIDGILFLPRTAGGRGTRTTAVRRRVRAPSPHPVGCRASSRGVTEARAGSRQRDGSGP